MWVRGSVVSSRADHHPVPPGAELLGEPGDDAGRDLVADIQRTFNALFATTVAYKPFHNQLAKYQFGRFMRELVELMLENWVVRMLQVAPGSAFCEFERIIIQEGSSFAIKESLAKVYPGRFKTKEPAAVELHVSMDLLGESLTKVTLTRDTFAERAELPEAEELRGSLLLADRGYFDISYLAKLQDAGAHYVVRGFTTINPKVRAAYAEDGKVLEGVQDKTLKELCLPKRKRLDLDVVWPRRSRE